MEEGENGGNSSCLEDDLIWCDSPWFPKYQAILLTGQANSGGVDDGHEPLDVRCQHAIEELLIPVLETHEEHISEKDREKVAQRKTRLI